MNRRTFITSTAAAALVGCSTESKPDIIDTHTHFYDPSRPQGVPWPNKKSKIIYRTVLPPEFMQMTKPFGVTGTVVVEASPWLEDNQWLLDLAEKETSIVGIVGNVDPTIEDFNKHISRFAKNKLFRGIRLKKSTYMTDSPEIIKGFKTLADLDLSVDLNGGVKVLEASTKISQKVPELRQVIDHLPINVRKGEEAQYDEFIKKASRNPNVSIKVSNVIRKVNGETVTDPEYYHKTLDELWDIFGPDRVIFGSNWPVSDRVGTYEELFNIVDSYVKSRGQEDINKYYSLNAKKYYKWIKR